MWSHRDVVIVPWISQRPRPRPAGRTVDDDAANNHFTIQTNYHVRDGGSMSSSTERGKYHRSSKIVQLLQTRQRAGTSRSQSRVGRLTEGLLVGPDALAGVGAWWVDLEWSKGIFLNCYWFWLFCGYRPVLIFSQCGIRAYFLSVSLSLVCNFIIYFSSFLLRFITHFFSYWI